MSNYAWNKLLITDSGIQLNRILMSASGLYCYGAEMRGNRFVEIFPKAKWKAFVDRELHIGIVVINHGKS